MKLSNVIIRRQEWDPGILTSQIDMYFTDGYMWGFRLDDGMTREEVAERLLRAGNHEKDKLAQGEGGTQ